MAVFLFLKIANINKNIHKIMSVNITVIGQGDCEFTDEWSMLDALEEKGFDTFFSCCGGNCGLCCAKLISGEVEEIQEGSFELMEGEILTCSVIPKTDVVIEFVEQF